ncbi:MAG: hypothetical protein GXP55_01340 [Deltaproteobacteria bacterium]|nr:hypothetical protein [Deltaproteobacteria bacterium]
MEHYQIEKHESGVVLRFPEYVDELRGQADDDEAFSLVDEHERIVIDLSISVEVVSRWLKLFHRMAIRARNAGKQVFLVGASKSIRETADFLALDGSWETADTSDEALAR